MQTLMMLKFVVLQIFYVFWENQGSSVEKNDALDIFNSRDKTIHVTLIVCIGKVMHN